MQQKFKELKVIIVDDEIGMCNGVIRILDQMQFEITNINTKVTFKSIGVTSGKDFQEAFARDKFDIVLLDYKLPDANGLELLKNISALGKDTLTIMITAYATFETAVMATKIGAYDFIAKPFTPDELRYVIKKATQHYLYALNAKEHEAEKKKIRFQFISVLSHELKSPLNAVDGYINILKSQNSDIDHDKYLNILNRCEIRIDGMKKLILDLLDLTRIESGERKRVISKIDIDDLIRNAIDNQSFESKKRNIKINYQSKTKMKIEGDPGEIEIIVNNLLSNAIKYNVENGIVDIELELQDNCIRLSVADKGIGINEKDLDKIFQDFVRIKSEKTSSIPGSGLGLSIVKKIVHLYNGEISVKSSENNGSTFVIILPIKFQNNNSGSIK